MSEDQGKQTITAKLSDGVHGTLLTMACPCCGDPLQVFVSDDGAVHKLFPTPSATTAHLASEPDADSE